MSLLPSELELKAHELLSAALTAESKIATAESCTGGLIAAALTAIAGSSRVFERGFVTYSNEAKTEQLGVPSDLLDHHGAVSEAVARAMAAGALSHSHAGFAVAVTGIAGPGGGSPDKPAGTVHFAAAGKNGKVTHCLCHFSGDRDQVRLQSALQAMTMLINLLAE